MNISNNFPPNIEDIKKVFAIADNFVYTYGDVIFNPSGKPISLFLMKHEEAHSIRQGGNPKEWWERYLVDKDFRAKEEIEAYQVQYREAKKFVKDRNELYRYLAKLAEDLSGKYGLDLTFLQAIAKIRL